MYGLQAQRPRRPAQGLGALGGGMGGPQMLGSGSGNVGTPPIVPASGGELSANGAPGIQMPDMSGYFGTSLPNGKKLKPKKINRLLAQQSFGLRQAIMPSLIGQLNTLIGQANTDRFSPEERSSFLAPRLQALDEGFDMAEGALDRNLSGRGLDTSSAAVQGFAGLGQRRAQGRADTINDLFESEEDRQMMAQAQARDLLASLMGGAGQQAGSAASAHMQQRLMEKQLEAMEGDPFSDILGSLGALGGAYLGRPRFPSLGASSGYGGAVGSAAGGMF